MTSAIQTQINSKQATITGGATTIASDDLTESRALVSNSSGKVAASSVTSAELGFLTGVTSNVQTQLDARPTATESKARNGYIKFGNGIIIQWGTTTSASQNTAITLPTPFSNTNYSVTITSIGDSGVYQRLVSANTPKTTTKFTTYAGGGAALDNFSWIAIGY